MTKTNINASIINENAVKEKYLRLNKAKLTAAKIAAAAMIITALMLSQFWADPVPVAEPNRTSAIGWHDNDNILHDDTRNVISQKNAALRDLSGVNAEIIVVVEQSGNRDLTGRAERLFKDYKVNDAGMLFIVSVPETAPESRNVIEEWGRNIGEKIADFFSGERDSHAYYIGRNVPYSLKNEIEDIFADNFHGSYAAADYNAAVLDTFSALLNYFEQHHNISTADYNYVAAPDFQPAMVVHWGNFIGIIAIIGAALIFAGMFSGKKYKKTRA